MNNSQPQQQLESLAMPPQPKDGTSRRRGRRERSKKPTDSQQQTSPPSGDDGSQWLAMRPHGAKQGIFVRVPLTAVFSIPAGVTQWTFPSDIILCPAFHPADPASCPMGPRCAFVHSDPRLVLPYAIHVNYAWRSLDEVTYERCAPGTVLVVSPPNSGAQGDVMDSGMALKTRAFRARRRPLSHCAHYYFNRTCNLGAECRFVHAVFIDPQAKEHQRTPAPVQLGRATAAGPVASPQQAPPSGLATPGATDAVTTSAAPFRQHHPYNARPVGAKETSSSSPSSRASSIAA